MTAYAGGLWTICGHEPAMASSAYGSVGTPPRWDGDPRGSWILNGDTSQAGWIAEVTGSMQAIGGGAVV